MQFLSFVKAAFFIMPLLLRQGIPLSPSQTGTVTGTVRTPEGKPAVGVRIAARVLPETPQEAATALSSLASSDEEGRYRLEAVPPGRYYITAGRVDTPTFYPGTTDMPRATEVRITAGGSVAGVDFTIQEVSLQPALFRLTIPLQTFAPVSIPVSVKAEGKLPVFSDGAYTTVRITRISDGLWTEIPLETPAISVPLTPGGQDETFRVTVHGLGADHRVQSIKYGETDVTSGTIKLSTTSSGSSRILPTSALNAGLPQQYLIAPGLPAASSPFALGITIETTINVGATPGARVSGRAPGIGGIGRRSVYLSGVPGTLYADETFEFRGVPNGRHILVTRDNPQSNRPLGAVVVVADADIRDVELQPLPFLPADITAVPHAAGAHPPGSMVPLKSIRARIVDAGSQQPIGVGTIRINDTYSSSIEIDGDGRFEVRGLLPGRYTIDVQIFEYERITESVEIDDEDVAVLLAAKRRF
jgi:hypothetical protein